MPLPPGDRSRLFVAFELPDAVRAGLRRTIEPFLATAPLKWVPEANYHVTVRFLGPVVKARLEELAASLSEVAGRSAVFHTQITAFGSFPAGGGPARVLWAGLKDGSGRLAELVSQVDVIPGWLPAQKGDYTAHVTLARCDPPRGIPPGWLTAQVPADRFPVRWLTLFESRAGADGSEYRQLQRFPLGA